ncbi:putative IPP1-inorganic pyrophosphatase [Halteromyces radiatus]|uniref:putative IPP1-inorganic pyrophosphatase n=1 Tax=Halteromyces radiatus TaxID=101107 RepID=UPI0022211C8D|nr:putative IPP1-inorganic pyrophosphatase [Halteromyces radiatus]KAI8077848.1 putative IPP1-inorganic pyrophosphatase [Halteromyces radiatus]
MMMFSLCLSKGFLPTTKAWQHTTFRTMAIKTFTKGQPFTPNHRVYFENNGQVISPFHDIPLYPNNDKSIVNMVVEVPRWTNAKVEIGTKEPYNPIKQDMKKGKLRFVGNCFPYKGYIWNYGALPQTWEDPNMINEDTKAKGDNDPLDVCEIGQQVGECGDIKQVKILGVMALLDEGETDWKLLAIDIKDPLANKLNDIKDVEQHFPGLIDATRRWFRIYKLPDGKPENEFAFDGECRNKDYAVSVVQETHEAWRRLIRNQSEMKDLSLVNVTVEGSPFRTLQGMEKSQVTEGLQQSKDEISQPDERWYYYA